MIAEIIIEGEELLQLIPQRPPMVMIDRFFGIEENESHAGLLVSPENLFFQNGHLQEAGIIEHIAQAAAARVGYIATLNKKPIPLGFIGSVDKLTIHWLPKATQYLFTLITILQQVGDITLIDAKVKGNGQLLAECRMKIFIKK